VRRTEQAAAGGNLVEGDPSVSSRTPQASVQAAQSIAQGDNQLSEKKRAIIAMTRILGSGTLDEESLRLLEQLADCIQRPQTGVTREAEPVKQAAAQQVTPARGEPVETEVERVVAAREARERETSASGQLTAPEAAGRRETKEPCPMETAESTGHGTSTCRRRRLPPRRDGEPLTNAAKRRRQTESETDAEEPQTDAGERPPSPVREDEEEPPPLAEDPAGQQARLAAMKKQLASIAAQPRVLWLPTASAETPTPAETDLVPTEADRGSAEERLVPAEADLVPAEADQGSAEEQLVPAQMQLVPAEADLVPAEAPMVSTRARPADTARKRTPSAVMEDPGPVLPSGRKQMRLQYVQKL